MNPAAVKWTLALGLMGTILGGCGTNPPASKSDLLSGCDALARENYAQAMTQVNAVLDSSDAEYRGEAYYLRGVIHEKTGDPDYAQRDWRRAKKLAQSDRVFAHAQLALADLAYQKGDLDRAAEGYRECIRRVGTKHCLGAQAQKRLESIANAGEGSINSLTIDQPNRYTIQVGAFASRDNATSLVKKLRAEDLPAQKQQRANRSFNKPLYVVTVGRYRTKQKAKDALQRIRHRRRNAFISVTR